MPVHIHRADPLLVVTVDGDFTVRELERVVAGELDREPIRAPVPVLLDLTGAASLDARSDQELARCTAVFQARAPRIRRLAVLVSGEPVGNLVRMGAALMRARELQAAPFRSGEAARSWLREASSNG